MFKKEEEAVVWRGSVGRSKKKEKRRVYRSSWRLLGDAPIIRGATEISLKHHHHHGGMREWQTEPSPLGRRWGSLLHSPPHRSPIPGAPSGPRSTTAAPHDHGPIARARARPCARGRYHCPHDDRSLTDLFVSLCLSAPSSEPITIEGLPHRNSAVVSPMCSPCVRRRCRCSRRLCRRDYGAPRRFHSPQVPVA